MFDGQGILTSDSKGQIRHLEYSPLGDTLLFTTTLLNAVQRFSLSESRLLSPGSTHPSPPTVLAISPSNHLLLSASENPPIIYIQSLLLGTQPTRFQPWVTSAPVAKAAFNKNRPNVFVLAFKDGTIAAYDFTKLPRQLSILSTARLTGAERQPGEIGHFKRHHAVTTVGGVEPGTVVESQGSATQNVAAAGESSVAVTGLDFIAGFRVRAVSVGADGRCKVVDFERLNVLREWHVKGPATALSILALKQVQEDGLTVTMGRKPSRISFKPSIPGQKSGPEACYIAIGRVDGRVLIYDTQGSLLRDIVVDGAGEKVVDVEWIRGPKPEALDDRWKVEMMKDSSWIDLCGISGKSKGVKKARIQEKQGRKNSVSQLTAIPSESENAVGDSFGGAADTASLTLSGKEETQKDVEEMPTEDFFDTVKHQKLEGPIEREIPHVTTQGYMDFFSPVKPVEIWRSKRESPKRRTSARPRPRVTSSTYRSPVGTPNQEKTSGTSQSQPTSGGGEREAAGPNATSKADGGVQASDMKIQHRSAYGTYRSTPGAYVRSSSTLAATASSASSTSKILADIKRFANAASLGKEQKPGSLAVFAPYMQSVSSKPTQKRIGDDRRRRRSSTFTAKARRRSSMLGDPRKSKTEIVDPDLSPTRVEVGEEDIWLSAESGAENGGDPNKTRRGRRTKQQMHDSIRRRRSRDMSGRPRRPSGATGIGERADRSPEGMKIRRTDRSMSSYHSQSPSSLFPTPLLTLTEMVQGNSYSPSTQSLPSAFPTPSLSAGGQGYPSLHASSVTPASTSASTDHTGLQFQHPSIGSSPPALPSCSTSGPTEETTSHSTALSTSVDESEDAIVPSTPRRARFTSAPTLQLPLPPGYAESFHGPVEMQNYLPRKGSLAAAGNRGPDRAPKGKDERKKRSEVKTDGVGRTPRGPFERARGRRGFGRLVSGNADMAPGDAGIGKDECIAGAGTIEVEHDRRSGGEEEMDKCCEHCEELRGEVQKLRDEVRSLRRMVKGKGKATMVTADI